MNSSSPSSQPGAKKGIISALRSKLSSSKRDGGASSRSRPSTAISTPQQTRVDQIPDCTCAMSTADRSITGSTASTNGTTTTLKNDKMSVWLRDLKKVMVSAPSNFEKTLAEYEEVRDQKKNLEEEIKAKNKELQEMKKAKVEELKRLNDERSKERKNNEFTIKTLQDTLDKNAILREKEYREKLEKRDREVAEIKAQYEKDERVRVRISQDLETTSKKEKENLIREVQRRIAEANEETEELKKERDQAREEAQESQRRVENTEAALKTQMANINEYERAAADRNSQMGIQKLNHKEFSSRLQKFAHDIHNTVQQHFSGGFPKDLDDSTGIFAELRSQLIRSRFLKHPNDQSAFKIPISKSSASKHLRMARVENIIADAICQLLFPRLQVPKGVQVNPEYYEIISGRLNDNVDPRFEAIWRSLTCKALNVDPGHAEDSINDIAANILSMVGPLLVEVDAFRNELLLLLGEAADIWKKAQHSPDKVSFIFSLSTAESNEWLNYPEENQVPLSDVDRAAISGTEDVIPPLPLFPRWIVEDNQDDTQDYNSFVSYRTLHEGVCLQSNSTAVLAGMLEEKIYLKESRNFLHMSGRPASIYSGTVSRKPRRGSVPTSPTMINKSFPERASDRLSANITNGVGGGVSIGHERDGL